MRYSDRIGTHFLAIFTAGVLRLFGWFFLVSGAIIGLIGMIAPLPGESRWHVFGEFSEDVLIAGLSFALALFKDWWELAKAKEPT